MKMYAMAQLGDGIRSIAPTWHFSHIRGIDGENCALKMNKAERELMLVTGFDVDEKTAEYGSYMLSGMELMDVRNSLVHYLRNTDDSIGELDMRKYEAFLEFFYICIENDYVVRFY